MPARCGKTTASSTTGRSIAMRPAVIVRLSPTTAGLPGKAVCAVTAEHALFRALMSAMCQARGHGLTIGLWLIVDGYLVNDENVGCSRVPCRRRRTWHRFPRGPSGRRRPAWPDRPRTPACTGFRCRRSYPRRPPRPRRKHRKRKLRIRVGSTSSMVQSVTAPPPGLSTSSRYSSVSPGAPVTPPV